MKKMKLAKTSIIFMFVLMVTVAFWLFNFDGVHQSGRCGRRQTL